MKAGRRRALVRSGSRRGATQPGWLRGVRRLASPNHGPRPADTAVTLLVVHSISLPPGQYGGDAIERLFTNRLDFDAHPYYQGIRGLQVSSHFVIGRDGRLTQYVSGDRRAWHAGKSSWLGRDDCNDWSIGIELEGLEGHAYTARQYRTLVRLTRRLVRRWPITHVAGHEHIAPGRKHDPGARFDWARYARLVADVAITFPAPATLSRS